MAINNSRFLVLGGTGSIGYAFTLELLRQQEQTTLLVRNKQKAANLFGQWPTLRLIEGDAQDEELLKKSGAEATHIFHGINYPYEKWQNNMERVTQSLIEAAAINKSTIFSREIYIILDCLTPSRRKLLLIPSPKREQLR